MGKRKLLHFLTSEVTLPKLITCFYRVLACLSYNSLELLHSVDGISCGLREI